MTTHPTAPPMQPHGMTMRAWCAWCGWCQNFVALPHNHETNRGGIEQAPVPAGEGRDATPAQGEHSEAVKRWRELLKDNREKAYASVWKAGDDLAATVQQLEGSDLHKMMQDYRTGWLEQKQRAEAAEAKLLAAQKVVEAARVVLETQRTTSFDTPPMWVAVNRLADALAALPPHRENGAAQKEGQP